MHKNLPARGTIWKIHNGNASKEIEIVDSGHGKIVMRGMRGNISVAVDYEHWDRFNPERIETWT